MKNAVMIMIGLTLCAESYAMNGQRLFHAKGTHTCWSSKYIGYKCEATGINYTDCQEAFVKLKMQSCCKNMFWQGQKLTDGNSTGFVLNSCTNWL